MAAGKAIPEERRQAREAQKKTVAEAEVIIAKNQLKQAETAATSGEAKVDENAKNILTTTQWLSIISIFVSLAGIYYKREEIKTLFTKKEPPVDTVQRAPPHHLLMPYHHHLPLNKSGHLKNELNFSFFLIIMVPKVDALKGLTKTAAVSGIVLFSVNFRVEAFKMSWHIILTSPEEEETWKAVKKVMCENCQEHFIYDGD